MKIKMFTLPNFITLGNLACGCAAVVFALQTGQRLNIAFWLILAAAVLDFLDGFTARLTGQYSKIGAQLDSLADMVSFGVAPSVVLFVMYRYSFAYWNPGPFLADWPVWLMFAVALFSALRLAKFNIDDSQAHEFTGLPVPANALLIGALGWLFYANRIEVPRELLLLLAAVSSYLLICPVRMFSLKFSGFGWNGNELRYVFLLCCAVLVAVYGIGGLPMAVFLYIIVSAIRSFCRRKAVKSAVSTIK